jgi:hypothetical protein
MALLGLALVALGGAVLAENIDPSNDNSQFAYGENVGWLNAEPSNCSGCGVQVGATRLSGWMYGEVQGEDAQRLQLTGKSILTSPRS